MKYNQTTFWPATNIAEWDINSINSNFTLIQWNMDMLFEQENILSFWTPYEEAAESPTALAVQHTLYNEGNGLRYHEGIIYSGLEVETDKNYKRINLYPDSEGEYSYLDVKPGSIIYAVDFTKAINDSRRYLVVESPVKYGYNFSITNGLMQWTWGVLDTVKKHIKGPTGATNWGFFHSFIGLKQYGSSNLLSFKIPLNNLIISSDLTQSPDPYDVFSIRFKTYTTSEGEHDIDIPHKAWVEPEIDFVNNVETYFFRLVFLVTSNTTWKNLFDDDKYRLIIW